MKASGSSAATRVPAIGLDDGATEHMAAIGTECGERYARAKTAPTMSNIARPKEIVSVQCDTDTLRHRIVTTAFGTTSQPSALRPLTSGRWRPSCHAAIVRTRTNGGEGRAWGDSSSMTRRAPAWVSMGVAFTSLTTGGQHTRGRRTTGTSYCWGYNEFGHLENGNVERAHAIRLGGRISLLSPPLLHPHNRQPHLRRQRTGPPPPNPQQLRRRRDPRELVVRMRTAPDQRAPRAE